MTTASERMSHYLDRAAGAVSLIAAHETDALCGLWSALSERLAVARRARNIGELIRDQIDLLPESRNRFAHEQAVRRELWRGLAKDLAVPVRKPA
ncbi:MAG: hypothetical protein ACRETW_07135 [Stenotrophobium sp.]